MSAKEETEEETKQSVKLEEWTVKMDGKCHKNNSVMVKNINGTSKAPYKIDKLYNRYVKAGGNAVKCCQAKGCANDATATAHVVVTDGRRKNGQDGRCWKLTRLCTAHNNHYNQDEIPLRKNAVLLKVTDVRATTPSLKPKKDSADPEDTVVSGGKGKSATNVGPAAAPAAEVGDKNVHVKGYTKSNGTVVDSYTRSAPSAHESTTSPALVQVKGYTKSNGTVVDSYTRSAPSKSSSSSSSSSVSSPSSSSLGMSGTSCSSSSGTYVSGYTRSNGTVVSGYYRGSK